MKIDLFEEFGKMLHTALGGAVHSSNFLEMMAEDAVMEFPYAPADGVPRVHGRAALREYLSSIGAMLEFHSISQPTVHKSQEPGVFILEFSATGRIVATDLPYRQKYISVITVADGHIVHYRDYWNPMASRGSK